MPSDRFAGAVSHPYLMSGLAYHTTSSPIHRGVFIAKRLLGRNLRPPVDAIIPLSEEASPGMTTRERVALQTQGAMCQSCHRVINPLGFTLENFDAIGRFRSQEFDREVDAQGEYVASDGQAVAFRGPRELAEFLAGSEEARLSMVRQMFHHLVKQPLAAHGPESMRKIADDWAEQGCTLRSLVHTLAILGLTPPPTPSSSASQALIPPPSSAKIAVAE
jgi:hypothetical protein